MYIMVIYILMASILENCDGFEWDGGNSGKNWHRHRVTDSECEDVFFNLPLIVAPDVKRGNDEQRYFALGRTDADRRIFIAFTIRAAKVRVISAREMTKSEE